MKQLHKQGSLNFHRRDEESPATQTPPYSPKTLKHHRSLPRSIHYLFREQRLLFILVGILIGSTFFILQPTLSRLGPNDAHSAIPRSFSTDAVATTSNDVSHFQDSSSASHSISTRPFQGKMGRVPVEAASGRTGQKMGKKRRRRRRGRGGREEKREEEEKEKERKKGKRK